MFLGATSRQDRCFQISSPWRLEQAMRVAPLIVFHGGVLSTPWWSHWKPICCELQDFHLRVIFGVMYLYVLIYHLVKWGLKSETQ